MQNVKKRMLASPRREIAEMRAAAITACCTPTKQRWRKTAKFEPPLAEPRPGYNLYKVIQKETDDSYRKL